MKPEEISAWINRAIGFGAGATATIGLLSALVMNPAEMFRWAAYTEGGTHSDMVNRALKVLDNDTTCVTKLGALRDSIESGHNELLECEKRLGELGDIHHDPSNDVSGTVELKHNVPLRFPDKGIEIKLDNADTMKETCELTVHSAVDSPEPYVVTISSGTSPAELVLNGRQYLAYHIDNYSFNCDFELALKPQSFK